MKQYENDVILNIANELKIISSKYKYNFNKESEKIVYDVLASDGIRIINISVSKDRPIVNAIIRVPAVICEVNLNDR